MYISNLKRYNDFKFNRFIDLNFNKFIDLEFNEFVDLRLSLYIYIFSLDCSFQGSNEAV